MLPSFANLSKGSDGAASPESTPRPAWLKSWHEDSESEHSEDEASKSNFEDPKEEMVEEEEDLEDTSMLDDVDDIGAKVFVDVVVFSLFELYDERRKSHVFVVVSAHVYSALSVSRAT